MDLLNLGSSERLDAGDLLFALNDAPTGLVNELTGNFLLPPGTSTIVTGFRPSGSGQGPVQIGDAGTPNVALLGQRIGTTVTQGVFTAVGAATQSLSVSTLPANTYGIFVRFNRLPGASQARKFWAKSAPGSEYQQLVNTRLVATWEARIEVSAPSAEWLKVGQVVVTSAGSGQGSTIVVTDLRTLYFEGSVASGYPSRWGSAADRSSDRSAANTGSLQRQLDALRACIVDIKGRGLATWYQPNISGLQVGSGFSLSSQPTANQISIGDDNFFLLQSGTLAGINFDGGNDYLFLARSTGVFSRVHSGNTVYSQDAIGNAVFAGSVAANFSSPGYALSATSTSTSYGTGLGLISTQRKQCFVAMGAGFGVPSYLNIVSDWSGFPTNTFFAQNRAFLVNSQSASTLVTTSLQSDNVALQGVSRVDLTAPGVYVNSRPLTGGMQVWAAGVYTAGSGITQLASGSGLTASGVLGQDNNYHNTILVSFSQNLPTNAIINVSGQYNENGAKAGKVYQTSWIKESANSFRVGCANANQDPEDNGFSFIVLWGS